MKQKAYIFKSRRARQMLIDIGITLSAKNLQGKTFQVRGIEESQIGGQTVIIDDPVYKVTWHIPIDACNVIDCEEGEG